MKYKKRLMMLSNLILFKKVCLLHGVTSSGKTEIYIKLRRIFTSAEQILYLLPEIALTTQLVGRLRAYFE
jgi:primosomal protein N' (replication factor Y)